MDFLLKRALEGLYPEEHLWNVQLPLCSHGQSYLQCIIQDCSWGKLFRQKLFSVKNASAWNNSQIHFEFFIAFKLEKWVENQKMLGISTCHFKMIFQFKMYLSLMLSLTLSYLNHKVIVTHFFFKVKDI